MPETTFRWAPQTIVDQLLHKGFPEIIRELRDWVAIPSVSDPEKAAPGAPFGPEAGRMLDAFIRTAEKWGFTTTYKHPDGYYAYAEVGTGKQIIDIPGHGDVVDAGNPADWDNGDPWKLETKTLPDGTVVFVGRGVADDKGSTLVAMKAAATLAEIIGQSHKIRVPFFIDEERGEWDDVKLFLREQAVPEFAFVPDAFWPPIGGEQDINMVTIDALSDVPPMQIESSGKPHQNSITIKHLTTFKNPKNTIPDLFEVKVGTDNPEAVGQLEKLLREKIGERVTIQHDDNDVESVTFTIKGEKAHSSMPWAGTLSAVLLFTWAVEDVSYMFTDNPASRALRLVREVGYDSAGAQLFGIDDSPMQNGINTVNIGVLNADRQKVEIGVDVRIRQTLTIENVDTAIEAAAGRAGLKVNPAKAGKLGGIHVPPDSIPLLTALEAYKRWTGDKDAVPQTIGGGTFARAFQAAGAQAVACGLFPPYQRVTDHITNEYVPLHMLQLGALTYLDMLAALAGDPKKLMAIGSAADPLTMSTTTGRMAGFAANRGMMLPFLSNPNLAEKMPPSGELLRHAEESLLTVEQRLAKMAEKK